MRVAILGDLAFVGRYDARENPTAAHRLRALSEYLDQFDLVLANLESPFTKKKSSLIPKSIHLRSDPENAVLLGVLGIDAVNLANNHIYDFGKRGVIETTQALDAVGIHWFGIDEKRVNFRKNGDNVSLSGAACLSTHGAGISSDGSMHVNLLTRHWVDEEIRAAKKLGALPIVSLHWGAEHTHSPNREHIELMKSFSTISNSAVIAGSHPHVIQGISTYGDLVVAYSLGNCVFDTCSSLDGRKVLRQIPANERGLILELEVSGSSLVSHRLQGFVETEGQIVMSSDPIEEARQYSLRLDSVQDAEGYEKVREKERSDALESKFGEHDLEWLRARLNYHTIGSRLIAILRNRRYRKLSKEFSRSGGELGGFDGA